MDQPLYSLHGFLSPDSDRFDDEVGQGDNTRDDIEAKPAYLSPRQVTMAYMVKMGACQKYDYADAQATK